MSRETFTPFALPYWSLEIIGEATAHVSEKVKVQDPAIAWRTAAGMRNILVQEYFDVDPLSIWVTSSEYVAVLERRLRAIRVKKLQVEVHRCLSGGTHVLKRWLIRNTTEQSSVLYSSRITSAFAIERL